MRWLLCVLFVLAASCATPGVEPQRSRADGGHADIAKGDTSSDAVDAATSGFEDHTVPTFSNSGDFFAFADTGTEPVQCKFVLTRFGQSGAGETSFMDPTFYTLHDEWYWFRMLNGAAIDGFPAEPAVGLSFSTVAEIVDAYQGADELPLGLKFAGDRLYAPKFYDAAFGPKRFFGLGSVLHFDADPDRVLPEELWLFELEFVDNLTQSELLVFYLRLENALPDDIFSKLKWLTRSAQQDALGLVLGAPGGPLEGKVVSTTDLVVKGAVEGYNPGITAGTLKVVPKGAFAAASLRSTDIVVLEEVPDYLPPVAGIITAVPQTPLAHLNLLAKSRGTPNVYVAGVLEDEAIDTWATWKAPVILSVSEHGVVVSPITGEQYETFKSLAVKKDFTLPEVDVTGLPYTVDLDKVGLAEMEDLVPVCGGKSAGMAALGDFEALDIPEHPLCVTIRAYAEHVKSLVATLEGLLAEPSFTGSPDVRFLVLEGGEGYLEQHTDEASAAWVAAFEEAHPAGKGDILGDVVAAGGVKRMIRDQPVDPVMLGTVRDALEERFAAFSHAQGLRFRSSSTAEDVPGFNGAGLYDSNTGYLYPDEQEDAKEKKRSIAWALRKTWASYWSYEAFEEREAAGIPHLDGNMAVLVHARFDDPLEAANGVVTLYLARHPSGDTRKMVVNVQKGALSVTNPEPGNPAQPEIDVVDVAGAVPEITRVQGSTEVPSGTWLLSDERLESLVDDIGVVSQAWLDQQNASLPLEHRSSTLVLDLEFREMLPGWPALASGEPNPSRFVVKQARTLDESQPVPDAIEVLPIPRDVLGKADRIQQRTCQTEAFDFTTVEVYTSPAGEWGFSYAKEPFNSHVDLDITHAIAALGLAAGTPIHLTHPSFAVAAHPFMHHGPWDLYLELTPEASADAGFESFTLYEWGSWSMTGEGAAADGDGGPCVVVDLLVSPSQYLTSLLEAQKP